MKVAEALNIKGILLNKEQLKSYLESIASDHTLKDRSDKDTYPIPRMIQNFDNITKTYDLLNDHLKLGIGIHQAGEWLLDNYYVIEETVKEVRKNLPLKKYVKFTGISSGRYQGYARGYVVASEIVSYTDGNFSAKDLEEYLESYQTKKTLNMEEIWNINLFFKIALIERINDVCTKIYVSQMQKLKVESILERLVEIKPKSELKFISSSKVLPSFGENSFSFIEYMSYKLKKYGKKGIAYLNILEEEINKQGLTLNEVIKKEHFDIALKKVCIGNAIKSIHSLQRMNFAEVFENINGANEILKCDPAGVYENMDYKTKEYYRNSLKEIGTKTKISEIYVARKVLELARNEAEGINANPKKSHIGYYLIGDGVCDLYRVLGVKKWDTNRKRSFKINLYIYGVYILSAILSLIVGFLGMNVFGEEFSILQNSSLSLKWIMGLVFSLVFFIPISEVVTKVIQNVLNKCVKPKLIPKMDFSEGIPEEDRTLITIPTILKNGDDVREHFEKLEVYFLANKLPNIFCLLLGDSTSEIMAKGNLDDEIINSGLFEVDRLNKKYGGKIFYFAYRNRVWNSSEKCYMGWERKRGMLTELNAFLTDRKFRNTFAINTLDKNLNIKYVITLDSDTELTLNSGIELIEAAAHPLNKPEVQNGIVVSGHALLQPRVGINLDKSRQSIFAEVYAGGGGVDSYTNAISDTYQDNFDEGIFTGKGIYDVQVFCDVLGNKIPENTVLSHDLLEGSYLRCGLASDVMLMDGFPKGYMAYLTRLHRWLRGDFQILPWLKKKAGLNKLSRFKILDNIRRALIEVFAILGFFLLCFFKVFGEIKIFSGVFMLLLSITIPSVLEALNYVIFKKENIKRQRLFTRSIDGFCASFYRAMISIMTLPTKAFISLDAACRTIYRMCISKEHLLEWTTSDEAEKKDKNNLIQVYLKMLPNVVCGTLLLLLLFVYETKVTDIYFLSNWIFKGFAYVLSFLWLSSPLFMWDISKERIRDKKLDGLSDDEKAYAIDIARRTWAFFSEYMNKDNSFLPPDNYQESRREKVVRQDF